MNKLLYEYDGSIYPDYLKNGNGCRFITPVALEFCKGNGIDVCAGKWPLPGAIPIDSDRGADAMNLPEGQFDYVFSSHGLEHLADPVGALLHWKSRLRSGGVLFLYLPHPDMGYWLPTRNRKHLHSWTPEQMEQMVSDLGFIDVLVSGRDMAWSFTCVGFKP